MNASGLILFENADIISISGNITLNAATGDFTMTGDTFIDTGGVLTPGKLLTSSEKLEIVAVNILDT